MHPLEVYLRDLRQIRDSGAGVAETSYYPAISTLLNAVGSELKPAVRCIINPSDRGAGIPDGGFFTPDQLAARGGSGDPVPGQLPARGALEVKGIAASAVHISDGEQVGRYVERYGQVLVTNLRHWILVAMDASGEPRPMEEYVLAPSEGQ